MPFGAVIPALLLALPAAAALLLYVYRRGGSGREVRVATVLLLKKISRPVFAPRKIRLPPRFFLELLIACLIGAAAAGLYLKGEGGRKIILLDNSLSMAAQLAVGSQSESRLESAKTEAEKLLSDLPLGAEVSVFVTSPGLSNASQGFVSKEEARRIISGTRAVYAADNIRSSIDRLLASGEGVPLTVLTDQRIRVEAGTPLFSAPTLMTTPLSNVAISSLRLVEGSRNDSLSVVAGFDAYVPDSERSSTAAIPLTVTLQELSFSADLKGVPLAREIKAKKGYITPGETLEIRFDEIPRSGQAFRIQLSLGVASSLNTLRLDDEVYFLPRETKGAPLFVSDLSSKQLGVSGLKGGAPRVITPDELSASSVTSATPFVVLHRFVPQKLPAVPLLAIVPPADSAVFPSRSEATPSQITRWLEGHPINRYLQFGALKLKEQTVLSVPGWAQEIVSSTHGPLIYAGELEGRRVVVSGLELLPFEGKKSPLLSILTLNIFKWLSGEGNEGVFSSPYGRVHLPDGTTSVRMSSGAPASLLAPTIAMPEEPSILIAEEATAASIVDAVNFFDPTESDTANAPPIDVAIAARETLEAASRSLVEPLAVFALVLLLMESLLWLFKNYRRGVNVH